MKLVAADVLAEAVERIVDHGMKLVPDEACGLLLPDGTLFFLTNEAIPATGQYLVSSAQLEAAVYGSDGVEDMGWDWEDCTIWHTHPSDTASPSQGDLESRRHPELIDTPHFVVALPSGVVAYF